MATPDEFLSPVDIKNSHVLTRVVERQVKESDQWDIPFAPITTSTARRIKLRVKNVNGAGLASFKADNADTPIVSGSGDITDIYMELFLIAEKEVIKASDLVALRSPDPFVAKEAAALVVEKGARLRQRNINRTKWMVWQAIRDGLSVTYPDGTVIQITYDLAGALQNSWFGATHIVTVSIAWSTTATATIIDDIFNATYRIAEDLGVAQEQCIMYVSSATWRNMKKNTGIKAELSTQQPRIITPTMSEVTEILGVSAVRIYNGFYVTAGTNTKVKFLGDSNVLITGPDTINGVPLVEVKDGPVARVVGNDIVVSANPGALSEVYINAEAVTKNVRVQTARLPQINYPAGLYWLTVEP